MVASKAIKSRYDEFVVRAPFIQRLVRERLQPFCAENHFGFEDRIKQLDSVAEKLETGRVASWDALDDMYAATIVVPSLRDESRVVEELDTQFLRERVRSRSLTRTPPDVFRFDCPRFYGRLRPSPELQGSPLESMLFEVQIRTAFEHAWSATTHALTYKSDHIDWRKLRLAAALRATVEQIDLAIAGFERTADEVMPGIWKESELKLRLLKHFRESFDKGRFPSEIRPAAWSRFVDNVYALCEAEAKSSRRRRDGLEKVIDQVIATIESWTRSVKLEEIPRSLSLFQTTFGILCRQAVLSKNIDFTIFGIQDIVDVFPEAKGVAAREL